MGGIWTRLGGLFTRSPVDYSFKYKPDLPVEIWIKIIKHLQFKDQISLSSVNHSFRNMVLAEIYVCIDMFYKQEPLMEYNYERSRANLLLRLRLKSSGWGKAQLTTEVIFQLALLVKNIKSSDICLYRKSKVLQSESIRQCGKLKTLENSKNKRYAELKLENVCLADNQGLVKGLCLHNNKPLKDYIQCLPPSIRRLEWTNEVVYLMTTVSSFDLLSYSNIFAGVMRQCPLLDTIYLNFKTLSKGTQMYTKRGLLGLSGFSPNIKDFQIDGNWSALSPEDFQQFGSRNSHLAILDIDVECNRHALLSLLESCRLLQMVRLRCGECRGGCQDLLTVFDQLSQHKSLSYLWIQYDMRTAMDKFLENLPYFTSLRVLVIERCSDFNESHFLEILEKGESLEIVGFPVNFTPAHSNAFWKTLKELNFPINLREIYFYREKSLEKKFPIVDSVTDSLARKNIAATFTLCSLEAVLAQDLLFVNQNI